MYSHFNQTAEQTNHRNKNRYTLGRGLAGLHWSPPTKTKFGKSGRGNSKSQYVRISHISAFPIVSNNVVGLPESRKECARQDNDEIVYVI
jgi:hypothetical protein